VWSCLVHAKFTDFYHCHIFYLTSFGTMSQLNILSAARSKTPNVSFSV
jgi:hypothetical protein